MGHLRPIPYTAFGFVLDDAFRRRWAQDMLDKDPALARKSRDPDESESLMEAAMVVVTEIIAVHVYHAVPGIPRLQPDLLPVRERDAVVPHHYVFVLQEDDRTLPPHPEDVERVREALGLTDDQEPVWVPILPIDRALC